MTHENRILSALLAQLWERHKNPLSWFMRPLFGAILYYGAWINNSPLLVAGIVGLSTSWFWFPKPKKVHPWSEAFLNREKEFITPPWTFQKLASITFVFMFLFATIVIFWRHSLGSGLVLMAIGGIGKACWSLRVAGKAGIPAALFGAFWTTTAVLLYFKFV